MTRPLFVILSIVLLLPGCGILRENPAMPVPGFFGGGGGSGPPRKYEDHTWKLPPPPGKVAPESEGRTYPIFVDTGKNFAERLAEAKIEQCDERVRSEGDRKLYYVQKSYGATAEIVRFHYPVSWDEARRLMWKHGYGTAGLKDLLAFSAAHPDALHAGPILALDATVMVNRWSLGVVTHSMRSGIRQLEVHQDEDYIEKGTRFLVLKKKTR